MLRRHKAVSVAIAAAGTLASVLAVAPATTAGASPTWHICHGNARHPGELTGRTLDVIVHGLCLVRNGPTAVAGSIIITPRATLVAAFGRHDTRLEVGGNIFVHKRGTLVLGCNPKSFPCLDDPHKKHPTLSSHDRVGGSIFATDALGLVVHGALIRRNVRQLGGGGGLTCKPQGSFAHVHLPAYTAWEGNWIGGSIWVKHLRSCWLGVIGNHIGFSATVSRNKMKDPDAVEVVTNVVRRDLTCWRNSPKVQFGDSHGHPNQVGLHAFFECGFHRIIPNPAGQHVHFAHISVHLH